MSRIEAGLHKLHASAKEAPFTAGGIPSRSVAAGGTGSAADARLLEAPFARVNSVIPGSPADDAGLRAGDLIRRFGSVNWVNHEKLSKVAETVQRSEGVSDRQLPIRPACLICDTAGYRR
jgi:26S proteasome non-ATPase regulatory subunit 9